MEKEMFLELDVLTLCLNSKLCSDPNVSILTVSLFVGPSQLILTFEAISEGGHDSTCRGQQLLQPLLSYFPIS